MDAVATLDAAAQGRIRVLVLLGADPIADFPDATLARRAIEGADTIIAVDAFASASTARADVFLPCTLWGEKTGSVTNLEGRVQRVGRTVAPEGTAMDDWRIAKSPTSSRALRRRTWARRPRYCAAHATVSSSRFASTLKRSCCAHGS